MREKRGIRDICKEDGRGFGTIVVLPLCHSASLSLYYKSFTLWLSSLLAATFVIKVTLSLLILSQLIPISVFFLSVLPHLLLCLSSSLAFKNEKCFTPCQVGKSWATFVSLTLTEDLGHWVSDSIQPVTNHFIIQLHWLPLAISVLA